MTTTRFTFSFCLLTSLLVVAHASAAWTEIKAAHAEKGLIPGTSATYFTTPRPVYELYDLDTDPSELTNLSGRPEIAEIEIELRTALAEKMILDFDYLPLPDLMDRPAPDTGAKRTPKKKVNP